ncbi:MAG: acyl-CoA dehydrogenase family protein, partial [Deltaproteobacteria bacterium]|nr:acyl-CoA dehydrogenase family protein [Deltaproteobacteria bacterium]
MSRDIYGEEHQIFRETFRKYVRNEIVPHLEEWEEKREIPRSAWKQFAEQGFLCPWLEEKYGGSEVGFEYSAIMIEELTRARADGLQVPLHSDIIAPYIHSFGSEEQKKRWLPGSATGDILLAVAMTEPGTGSDLQAIRTKADRDGDAYVLNGQKTFISNGICCDLVIVVCKTDTKAVPAHKGISLIAVEAGTPGFVKGQKLKKMGMNSADTAELYFEDCRVPKDNLIGEEGQGFSYLMYKLQQERLVVVLQCQAAAEAMLDLTVRYCKEREAFGQPIGQFQHNTFKLVEMATEIELGRTFVDDLLADHIEGKEIIKKVSMAKWWLAEMANRVAAHCVQLHGGYGYMEEYAICKWYQDIRASTIYAGTTEIMKTIIG